MHPTDRLKDRTRTFVSVGRALDQSRHPVLEEAVNRYRAMSPLKTAWQRSVTQPLCRYTHPVSLRDGVLTVHAESPVWANLLRNSEQSVVASLHESGLIDVRSVRVRIAPPNPAPDNSPPQDERDEDSAKFKRLFAQLRKALD